MKRRLQPSLPPCSAFLGVAHLGLLIAACLLALPASAFAGDSAPHTIATLAPVRAGSAFARPIEGPWSAAAPAGADSSNAAAASAPHAAFGVREDRWQHASLSFALASAAGAAGLEPASAALASLAFGLAKEWLDARHDRFDPADLAADAAGAALAALALHALMR